MSFREFIKTGSFWKHVALAGTAVLLFLWGCFLFLNFFTLHNEHMEVPDFKGVYMSDLDKFVSGKELEYEVVDSVYNDQLPKGTVIDQEPKAGSTVKLGRKIYLSVNARVNQKVPMPNLIDLSLRQAKSLLESYGLKVGRITYVAGLPPVMQQNYQGKHISPNALIDKGSSIDLVLGMGDQNSLIQVPELFGLTLVEARTALVSSGLVLGKIEKDEPLTDTIMARIFKQNPSPESNDGLYEGARVNVWITTSEAVIERESNKNLHIE
jgi:eukaryotic-like serine/threonine-protein kinase